MSNYRPPWATYRTLMSGRLIGLDKFPGVRPVGLGEIWRWILAKCMFVVMEAGAKEACGKEQLYSGLEVRI